MQFEKRIREPSGSITDVAMTFALDRLTPGFRLLSPLLELLVLLELLELLSVVRHGKPDVI
jgi:hypothetical protein